MSQRAVDYIESLLPVLSESEYAVAHVLATLLDDTSDSVVIRVEDLARLAHRQSRCVRYCLKHLRTLGILQTELEGPGPVRKKNRFWFPALTDRAVEPATPVHVPANLRVLNDIRAAKLLTQHEQALKRIETTLRRQIQHLKEQYG